MTAATTLKYSEFKILLGDGADPEVFTAICGLTSKGFNYTTDTSSTNVPDCTDEDLPSFSEKDIIAFSAQLSGSGVASRQSLGLLQEWMESGEKKNIQVSFADAPVGDPELYAGPAVLSGLNITANKGERVNVDITIDFASKPTVTAAT
jgi:Phage major tail protein 2.